MNRLRKIKFKDHPVLGNLELNFCDNVGHGVDTVIFAGENGTGKSTLLDCLYKIVSGTVDFEVFVEIEYQEQVHVLKYLKEETGRQMHIWVTDDTALHTLPGHNDFVSKYQISGIFSDVDINFHSQEISSVTSMTLDGKRNSRRSSNDLPREIKQLIIDIQALDDADLSLAYRNAKQNSNDTNTIMLNERMPRFTNAFNHMFNGLTYSRIENTGNHKAIIFSKNGVDIEIDSLSSGEKQIVYRGCFLLKDANALNGTFVFIDEPEISLHPLWQQRIMDYYKHIFSDQDGQQKSQIFTVTHSPFIIHNEARKNDKVIVIQRDENGNVIVSDKAEYYKCNSKDAIEDAFHITKFLPIISRDVSTVYLEGRTDEKYFNKALEVYGYGNISFCFKWVGYIDEKEQESNTGKDSLNKAAQFLISQNLPIRNVCLFDCDTARSQTIKNNVICMAIPYYGITKGMKKGIENALVLDDIELEAFYSSKIKHGDYGDSNTIVEFNKMACCNAICSMESKILQKVFIHLKDEIDKLINLLDKI